MNKNIKIHILYILTVLLSWVILVICMHVGYIADFVRVYIVLAFIASSIIIPISSKAFLTKFKIVSFQKYYQSRSAIIFVTIVYAIFLLLRGFDMIIDYVSGIVWSNEDTILKDISTFSVIIFYFIENIPPVVLILYLWMKVRTHDSSIDSLEESLYK